MIQRIVVPIAVMVFHAVAVGNLPAGESSLDNGGQSASRPRFATLLAVPPMTAPIIDGRVTSAAEWQAACQVTGWADDVLGVANNDGTIVSVGHAGGALYMLFRCPYGK
jgi:hypothetical protein